MKQRQSKVEKFTPKFVRTATVKKGTELQLSMETGYTSGWVFW